MSEKDVTAKLIRELASAGLTVAVAESLTGGGVCAELVRPAGASDVVVGGVVAYETRLKRDVLGVDGGVLEKHGPVHPDVAAQMAKGVRTVLAVDGRPASVGLATTGVAGPGPSGGTPAGTVFIALDADATRSLVPLHLTGDRDAVRRATVDAVIRLLVAQLPQLAARE